ncbi:hypothetical protein AVEN_174840-1 [Araneus ventricosus]|uniref:Uncharacterized protein n=1 Tax=Araneus ventricosus TaxID=182803 RepID=A0A4Y2SPN1_ARAVE|nr:hypothetical protein AVEN_125661-1 [Araneus ventricosus]GBN89673.1 hypothetical protein AVEN_258145-1 [Araneus ventricosus]GBN89701.1 hypothetical protein AVEN_212070-1 [Araneus ventricosus]GBN89707.1 hypothetical protein AVEN_174840-1 [Araneus ventricosus]
MLKILRRSEEDTSLQVKSIFLVKYISQKVVLYSLNNFNFVSVVGIPDWVGRERNIRKLTGKLSGSALKNSKPAICLRDHGIDVLRKIKFGVKADPKISDCI